MMETLKELSDDLAAIVERASLGVVRVDARRRMPASGIAWSEDGLIVTANHVVERDSGIGVALPNGDKVNAELVGRDPGSDLALLRVDAVLTPSSRADLAGVKVGHLALAVARHGDDIAATLGVVSVIAEGWHSPVGARLNALQTDVAMLPGFSGGALVGAGAEVIGMNTSAMARGASITVPVPTIERVVDSLKEHGKVRRGFLGVGAQTVKLSEPVTKATGAETGLLLVSVEEQTPAESAGLLLGDTVVEVAGRPTRHVQDLLGLLAGDVVGRDWQIKLVRGGELKTLTVTIGERP